MLRGFISSNKRFKFFLYLSIFSLLGVLFFALIQHLFEFLASTQVEGTFLSHLYGNLGVYTYFIALWVFPLVLAFAFCALMLIVAISFLPKHHTPILH
jgi:hypothetical protein